MKLWHDDCRRPPEGWVWARTNKDAKVWLCTGMVTEISLDHDLGGHHLDPDDPDTMYYRGDSEDNGFKLVDWMIREHILPGRITVHSWNSSTAPQMVKVLRATGHPKVYHRPFEAPKGAN